jgi:hypothetical protein
VLLGLNSFILCCHLYNNERLAQHWCGVNPPYASQACNLFILFFITVWLWDQFLKNGFLLVVIAVVYLQPWLKNKLVYVQYAKAVI